MVASMRESAAWVIAIGALVACALLIARPRSSDVPPAEPQQLVQAQYESKLASLQAQYDQVLATASHRNAPPDHSNQLATLQEELNELKVKYTNMHEDYVALVCKDGNQLAANGAWCLTPNGQDIAPGYPLATNHVMADAGLAEQIFKLFHQGTTVLDMGCGVGQYYHYFQKHHPNVISWTGYDGALNVEEFTNGLVKLTDLSKPQKFPGGARDWVICMEVGEHVPNQFEDILLSNIHRHNKCGAVLSWGIPGQGGHGHVNLLSNDDVIARMAKLGYSYDKPFSDAGREACGYWWFKGSFMVFRRNDAPASCNK